MYEFRQRLCGQIHLLRISNLISSKMFRRYLPKAEITLATPFCQSQIITPYILWYFCEYRNKINFVLEMHCHFEFSSPASISTCLPPVYEEIIFALYTAFDVCGYSTRNNIYFVYCVRRLFLRYKIKFKRMMSYKKS